MVKWETFDYECSLDGMGMTVHPRHKSPRQTPGMRTFVTAPSAPARDAVSGRWKEGFLPPG